jgi:hypothetical protein
MGTTNVMGIPFPENTDAVANGALAMKNLASQVDGRTGLVKVIPTGATNGVVTADGDVTVNSAVSSVTVLGAFSAIFDSYKIIYSGFSGSAVHNLQLVLGSTATGYYGFGTYGASSGSAVIGIADNNAARFGYVGGGGPYGGHASIDLFNPFTTNQTQVSAFITVATNFGFYGGRLADFTSYSSFRLQPDTGTLTGGTIRVYGYRN